MFLPMPRVAPVVRAVLPWRPKRDSRKEVMVSDGGAGGEASDLVEGASGGLLLTICMRFVDKVVLVLVVADEVGESESFQDCLECVRGLRTGGGLSVSTRRCCRPARRRLAGELAEALCT